MKKYEGYTLIFDVDGTICPIKSDDEKYEDLQPNSLMVEKIRECKEEGAKIIIFTSRNMKTYSGNLGKINKNTAPLMIKWLEEWDIPYDEIIFGKPWPGKKGFYVDDRSIRPDEFLNNDFDEIERICVNSRKI
jgi:capsule biosynthesis phosphatase